MMKIAEALFLNYFQVGQAALQSSDEALAELMFRQALEVASTQVIDIIYQADSSHGLGLSLLNKIQSRAEGQQHLRKAIRLYIACPQMIVRDFVAAIIALADSYGLEEFPERALPLLKEGVKVVAAREGLAAPLLVPLFKRMALIYSDKRYFEKADKYYRLASRC